MRDRLMKADQECGERLARTLEAGLPAIPLVCLEALTTAYANDSCATDVFAQQLFVLGNKDDVFLGITTSGNSANVIAAAVVAKAKGMKVIGLTGPKGGKLADIADVCIKAPGEETYKVQEFHLPIYHCLCIMLEDRFFGGIA